MYSFCNRHDLGISQKNYKIKNVIGNIELLGYVGWNLPAVTSINFNPLILYLLVMILIKYVITQAL